jgi:imidazolonepropionase-like amidohydrolase
MLASGFGRLARHAIGTVSAFIMLAAPSSVTARATAFVGVNVVPMDREAVLTDQTVIVEAGRIVGFGPRTVTKIPAGANRVVGKGRYLVPGLADMHAHPAYGDSSMSPAEQRRAMKVGEMELLLYVASGVTTVRVMAGAPALLAYKRRVADGQWVGPQMFVVSPIVDGPKPVWPGSIKASDDADMKALVDGFVRDGYDQIKVYNEIPRIAYARLLDEASKRNMPVVGHVPFSVGLDSALAGKQRSIEHFRGYDYDGVSPQAMIANGGRNAERFGSWLRMSDDRMRDLVRKTVAAGTWNCPTLVSDEMMSNGPKRAAVAAHPQIDLYVMEKQEVLAAPLTSMFPPEATAAISAGTPRRYKLLKMLSDAGAGLLIGTDNPIPAYVPGFTVIDEMQHFVNAGLSPYQAIKAATVDAARFMGVERDSGSIAPGKRADLILIDANPLIDVQNLWKRQGVMVAGLWLEERELSRRLHKLRSELPAPEKLPAP